MDIARAAFHLLVSGPRPLSVDGALFAGFPGEWVPLDQVCTLLLERGCPPETRDAVWAHLIGRAREQGGAWTVGCVGVALPALTAMAAELCAGFGGDWIDIEAEVLAGFLAAVPTVEVGVPSIMTRLRWAAYRAGLAAVRDALANAGDPLDDDFHSAPPRPPWGHPDFVLLRAVADGVITEAEADLIGVTRLERVSVRAYTDRHGLDYQRCKKARLKAEYRLVDYLQDCPDDDGGEPDGGATDHVLTAIAVARAARGHRRTRPRSVTDSQRARSREIRKSRSPNARKSGVRECGGKPPATRPTPLLTDTPEVPRCA